MFFQPQSLTRNMYRLTCFQIKSMKNQSDGLKNAAGGNDSQTMRRNVSALGSARGGSLDHLKPLTELAELRPAHVGLQSRNRRAQQDEAVPGGPGPGRDDERPFD